MTLKKLGLSLLVGALIGGAIGFAQSEFGASFMRSQCLHDGGHWSRYFGWRHGPDFGHTCRYG